ncbi:rRNA maturation RNase YbeY [Syntrophomonas wolfei]|jgi:probable rRNA maturation factor|uniref:Endoribonuclease YbeY n=1 Tax=Syntrophomonas wolfei subsp. wolfei (strain DSM 2245B / Goettingen) TaxID=335541 RepID=YBEY_SYNWW|nr:rRNA maturation RNase YbeY [Syntrophomonas wolfei]Q0AWN7.1 RecName: Full=Endoribonuclease YbeY [Syntrophomonas wolfei subsp. wolfei str. Goettingen G311]ABI68867.1 metal-dependent hydrolase [Syntrophomonas wolfei subsp. wolfei str. Goettingen G311]
METMIINQQNKINYTKEMQQVILNVANAVAKMVKLSPNTELSVMIVDNSYIKELNLIYRGENNPTDVLSFAMNELSEEEMDLDLPGEVNVLGDIVVSLEKAVSQSEEYGHSAERELGYLIAHGMLHLLGYDHENEEERNLMRNLEERIMHKVKLER